MSDMLAPHFRIEQVSRFERNYLLYAIDAVVHVHYAIHHSKDFLPIVDMPDVGLDRSSASERWCLRAWQREERPKVGYLETLCFE